VVDVVGVVGGGSFWGRVAWVEFWVKCILASQFVEGGIGKLCQDLVVVPGRPEGTPLREANPRALKGRPLDPQERIYIKQTLRLF
jgi:hypothetical protein